MFHLFMTTLASIKFDTFNFGNQPFFISLNLHSVKVPLYTVYKMSEVYARSAVFYQVLHLMVFLSTYVICWYTGISSMSAGWSSAMCSIDQRKGFYKTKVSKIYPCFHAMEKAYIGMACCLILLRKYIHIFT